MDTQELQFLWRDFVMHNNSIGPRMASILTCSRVVNAVEGCEIRIEVANEVQEEWFNEHIGELKNKVNKAGLKYSSLLPIRFCYLRKDGTVIKAQEKAPRPRVQQKTPTTMTPVSFKFPTREEMFQASVSNEINSSVTRLMNLVNSVDSSNNTAECKASFVTILEERTKVLSVEPSFVYADRYLSIINEPLSFIKNRLGADSDYYRDASNVIVNTYLDILIKIVNSNPSLTNVKEAEN